MSKNPLPGAAFLPALAADRAGILLDIKVVPGASRGRIVGMLGDRLKVAVAAPPEGGKANQAVCALLAEVFGVSAKAATVVAGPANPRKTVAVAGMTVERAAAALAAILTT